MSRFNYAASLSKRTVREDQTPRSGPPGCMRRAVFAFARARVTIFAMCGRFTQNLSWAEIHRLAGLIGQPRNLAPRSNIAPTTPIEVIRASAAGNELVPMYWGLVPSWWKKPIKELPATFNARAETLAASGRCFEARSNIVAASSRLRAFTNGLARKERRRRAISRRAMAARWLRRCMGSLERTRRRRRPSERDDHRRRGE